MFVNNVFVNSSFVNNVDNVFRISDTHSLVCAYYLQPPRERASWGEGGMGVGRKKSQFLLHCAANNKI